MRDARIIPTVPDCPGLVFHIAQLTFDQNDGPNGIYVDDNTYASGQLLRERIIDGVVYRFFVSQDHSRPPQPRVPAEQRIRFKGITYLDGIEVGIRLDAGVVHDIESVSAMIDQAIETRINLPELIELGERIVTTGFNLACEFIDVLRQEFDQYWLTLPQSSCWEYPAHYSAAREKWYTLVLSNELIERLEERRRGIYWWATQSHYAPKIIGNADMDALHAAELKGKWTFADEMLATAIIELHRGRVRSSILHAIIAYESASTRALEALMENKLKGLESASIVDAITREVSTATLGRVVLFHAEEGVNDSPLDWDKIENLYNTRNQIVHRGQRRLPRYEILRDQMIEVRSFVRRVQAAVRPRAVPTGDEANREGRGRESIL